MHEMSVALEVGRLVEERLKECPGRLLRVALEVGNASGVEPGSLEFCLEAVLAHPPFNRPVVNLAQVDGDALRLDFLEIDDGRPDN